MIHRLWLFALLLAPCTPALADAGGAMAPVAIEDLSSRDFYRRLEADQNALDRYRSGLRSIVAYAQSEPWTPALGSELPSKIQRDDLRYTFAAAMDYHRALSSLGQAWDDAADKLSGKKGRKAMALGYETFVAEYHLALDFLKELDEISGVKRILNEAVPQWGLEEGTLKKYRYHFLHLSIATEFAARETVYVARVRKKERHADAAFRVDRHAIWDYGVFQGPKLTLKNGLRILGRGGEKILFPVQKGVSTAMGDIKVWRPGDTLVAQEQLDHMVRELQPGDVLLTRAEWYMSTVGIPGYWPHTALYIGDPQQRKALSQDSQVVSWLRENKHDGDLESYLKKKFPRKYKTHLRFSKNKIARVIEAIGEGVLLHPIEKTCHCDSIAALRPRVSALAKARSIVRAFEFVGRPYDFAFDFRTDEAIVCSELVLKSYEGDQTAKGLNLPVASVAGRPVTPPNKIAEIFDLEYGKKNRQFDLVAFLDADENRSRSLAKDDQAFRPTWKRPKWHVWIQKLGGGAKKEKD